MSVLLRKHLIADANHTIHFVLPPEMGDEVEIIILPRKFSKDNSSKLSAQQESLMMAQMMDESGFAINILNSTEEDCWNDL